MQFPKLHEPLSQYLFNPVDFLSLICRPAEKKVKKPLRDPKIILFSLLLFSIFFIAPKKVLATECSIGVENLVPPGSSVPVIVQIDHNNICQLIDPDGTQSTIKFRVVNENGGVELEGSTHDVPCDQTTSEWSFSFNAPSNVGNYSLEITSIFGKEICSSSFSVDPDAPEPTGQGYTAIKIRVDDDSCPGSTPENPILNTALGCIPTNPSAFIGWIFKMAAFIGGGIAFLLMAWGTFLVITSSGNPEQLTQGKDIIVSAVSGLLFIIFAVFLLRLIGVDILRIPGFQ